MQSSFSFHVASHSRTSSSQSFKHDPSHRQQRARHNGGATTLALQLLLAIKQNCRRALWRLWSALDAGIHFTVTLADGEHSSWAVRRTNSITQETPIPPKTASAPESCSKGRPAARYPGGCPLSRCHMELRGASVEGAREKGYAWCYDQSSRSKRATARIGGSYQNSQSIPGPITEAVAEVESASDKKMTKDRNWAKPGGSYMAFGRPGMRRIHHGSNIYKPRRRPWTKVQRNTRRRGQTWTDRRKRPGNALAMHGGPLANLLHLLMPSLQRLWSIQTPPRTWRQGMLWPWTRTIP